MSTVTIACVLRSGGDFEIRHVQWLAKQVPGIVCLSDRKIAGVETRALRTEWPGWWAKMEAFGPAISGDMLLIDLDTVVVKLPEMPSETTVLTDWSDPAGIGSGFMYVTAADRARVWEAFTAEPRRHMQRCQHDGDQGFLLDYLSGAKRWGENVRSYKEHCKSRLPPGTDLVCFHGKPRPWSVAADWIPTFVVADFRDLILKHKGKRFCVMGGGPSLLDDLSKIDADIYISTNAHGTDAVEAHYVLAMDEKHRTDGAMGDYLRQRSGAPIISPHPYADVRLGDWPQHPRWVMSGLVATWAAFLMGAKVVTLAGCDAYDGDPGYMDEARKIARDVRCPVRIASGPLTELWPQYDPGEEFGRYKAHTSIDGWLGKDGRIQVRVRKTCQVAGAEAVPDQVLSVYRHEVHRLLKHRMVEEV